MKEWLPGNITCRDVSSPDSTADLKQGHEIKKCEGQKDRRHGNALSLPGASATYLMSKEKVTFGKHCSSMAEQRNPRTLCVMHVGQWSMEENGMSERAF